MLLRTPVFYPNFHCIADKCTDSCCIGWEIDIDDTTLQKYRKVKGDFGKALRDNICDGHFILTKGDRCPFLNQQGLCEIYRHLGEQALGDICREHPRFVEVYGDIMEQGVGLCCEEAVRLLLNDTDGKGNSAKDLPSGGIPVLQFLERHIDDLPDELPDEARKARDEIFAERATMFSILEQRDIPFNERLQQLMDYAVQVSGMGDSRAMAKEPHFTLGVNKVLPQWIQILGKGESFGPSWDIAYKLIQEKTKNVPVDDWCKDTLFSNRDGERIVAYMLFRYYAKSLFDGDSVGKVQFAIFFWLMLRDFGEELAQGCKSDILDPRISAVKLLSKQVEYSDEVMDMLAEAFRNDEHFSIESFRTVLG